MNDLATYLRFMQFYSHICHNVTSGATFFEDHEFFATLYGDYEGIYDGVVERCIGLGISIDLFDAHQKAMKLLDAVKYTKAVATDMFKQVLDQEQKLCDHIKTLIPSQSEGTRQFLGDICDKSEVRQYKLKQRIKV